MKLFALTEEGITVFVKDAIPHITYFCPECGKKVALRQSKSPVFFHVGKRPQCASKSELHKKIQETLLNELDGILLEVPFPSIKRIADVVWEREKIIFEVQCSPIALLEIEERNRNYMSLGYRVVWILYEKIFGVRNEHILRALAATPHYFATKEGAIFDKGRVFISFKKYPIPLGELSREFELRRRYWGFFFSGDALDCFLSKRRSYKLWDRIVNFCRGC